MKSNRVVPVLIGFSILACIVMMGVPWGPTPPFGNFSGEIVYASGEGNFELEGTYNLYECEGHPSSVELRLILGKGERVLEVHRETGTFSGTMDIGSQKLENVEARLEVDGRVVAKSVISLSSGSEPCVKIIRFASAPPES